MDERKKRIFKKALMLFTYIFVIISIFLIYITLNTKTLKRIGYNKEERKIINKLSKEEKDIILNYKYDKGVISIITNDNYNKDNLNTYLLYLTRYNNANGIVKYINEYKEIKEPNNTLIELLGDKYLIESDLETYLDYYNTHENIDIHKVVTIINTGIYNNFYTNIKPADLDKGMFTLVNKYNYLDYNYEPTDLVKVDNAYTDNNTSVVSVAYDNFINLVNAAKSNNLTIRATTCYRSYNLQKALYDKYVSTDGIELADTYSARPGFSEHQLGYSIDLTNGESVPFEEFQNTKEYSWLKDNAYKYGFILRYPKYKEYITGYIFEPWHIRYVGYDIAKYIYENDITYEEYYAYFIR